MFDTLRYVKRLEEIGISREQAESQVQIMVDIIETNLATSQDLKDQGIAVRQEMKDLGTDIRQEMKDLGAEIRQEMKSLGMDIRQEMNDLGHRMIRMESRLIIKLGAMLAVTTSLTVGVLGLFHKFF